MGGNQKGVEAGKIPVDHVVYPFPISYDLVVMSSWYGDSFPCCVLFCCFVQRLLVFLSLQTTFCIYFLWLQKSTFASMEVTFTFTEIKYNQCFVIRSMFSVISTFDFLFAVLGVFRRTLSELVGGRYQKGLMVVVLKVYRRIVLASWRNVVECLETESLFFEIYYDVL